MTTQTEPPPVITGGRVKSMKSKFENLSSLESLDISGALIKTSKPFASKFQRSATSLDLFASNKSKGVNDKSAIRTVGDSQLNMRRQSPGTTDTFLSKLTNRSSTKALTSITPSLNEIKENVEQISGLKRHTSDPMKRSSIRRSPACRVGEKPIKAVASKVTTKSVPEEEVALPEKIDKLLKRSVDDDDKFMQPGITDTLKAALRQPLPSGPPPKKPPRVFESPKENIDTIQLFEEKLQKENEAKTDRREGTSALKSTKNHSTSNLLSCIRCTTPIYDVVVPLGKDNTNVVHTATKTSPTEHIYMEPFGHLKKDFNAKMAPDIVTSSTPTNFSTNCHGNSNRSNSECSCPETHSGKGGDLHYLVS